MKHVLLVVFSSLSIALSETEIGSDLASSYNRFANDVYQSFSQSNDGNFAVSPLSAAVILTLVQTGAKGSTKAEIHNSLHLSNDLEKSQDSEVSSFISKLEDPYYEFTLANKLFLKNGYKIDSDFLNRARDVYKSDVENLDFTQSSRAAEVINQWVEEKTHQKIKNLVDPTNLRADTRLLLANAIYFKGFWQKPFWVYQTKKHDFFKSAKDTIQVDTMVKTKYYDYYESANLNARLLELPIGRGDASLVIILPNEIEGLKTVEKNIGDLFRSVNFTKERINLRLPKFEIESKIKLNSILQNLGIRRAFAENADFRGITAEENLHINNVVQKVQVKVHEKGVEAAAATYLDMIPLSGEYPDDTVPKDFFVDRPFIFYIKIKGAIAFLGRVTDPSL